MEKVIYCIFNIINSTFYHSRQPRLQLELSHWLRAVEYLRCYPRVLNLGYLSSNILYLHRSKYQIKKKEVKQPSSHPCSHVVFQEIFVTEATQGLSQKSKTAWINNQALHSVTQLPTRCRQASCVSTEETDY